MWAQWRTLGSVYVNREKSILALKWWNKKNYKNTLFEIISSSKKSFECLFAASFGEKGQIKGNDN